MKPILPEDASKRGWTMETLQEDGAATEAIPGQPNRRRERRIRVLKRADIVFNHGFAVFECQIRNLSSGGAMIEMANVLGVPARFELRIGAARARRACSVRWRTHTQMGVAFNDGLPLAA
jgi:hypothetical protein